MDEAMRRQAQASQWSRTVISTVNRHKRLIQWTVVLLGLLLTAMTLYGGFSRVGTQFGTRAGKRLLNSVVKPAELGIWLVAGLWAVHKALSYEHPFKEAARALFRFLQVIHIPLATVVAVAATVHGALYVRYLWKSDFHYWSGVAALGAMLVVVLLGLVSIKGRKSRGVHLVTGLVCTGLVVVHLLS